MTWVDDKSRKNLIATFYAPYSNKNDSNTKLSNSFLILKFYLCKGDFSIHQKK